MKLIDISPCSDSVLAFLAKNLIVIGIALLILVVTLVESDKARINSFFIFFSTYASIFAVIIWALVKNFVKTKDLPGKFENLEKKVNEMQVKTTAQLSTVIAKQGATDEKIDLVIKLLNK